MEIREKILCICLTNEILRSLPIEKSRFPCSSGDLAALIWSELRLDLPPSGQFPFRPGQIIGQLPLYFRNLSASPEIDQYYHVLAPQGICTGNTEDHRGQYIGLRIEQ